MNQPHLSRLHPAASLFAIASLALAVPAGAATFTWNFAGLAADIATGGTAPAMGFSVVRYFANGRKWNEPQMNTVIEGAGINRLAAAGVSR